MASRKIESHGRVVETAGDVRSQLRFFGNPTFSGIPRCEVVRGDGPAPAYASDKSMASRGRIELAEQSSGIGRWIWPQRLVARTGQFEIGPCSCAGEAPSALRLRGPNRGVCVGLGRWPLSPRGLGPCSP